MKFTSVLPLVAMTTAFVIPDEVMSNQIVSENQDSIFDHLPSKDSVFDSVKSIFGDIVEAGENAFDSAMSKAEKAEDMFMCQYSMTAFDGQGWLDSAVSNADYMDFDMFPMDHPHNDHPHKKHPHHPPHHHKPNLTVYELIAKSKYTTKLAKLINKYPNLVEALNGTTANYTVFAPTDKAFAKLPKHHKDVSEELIYQVLLYHVSDQFYPAGRVLASHTIPTSKEEAALGGSRQRLRVGLGLKGLAVNFYSRVVAPNIFGTNGVIHGIDSLLFPPPTSTKIIELLPGEFSTLQLAFVKTGVGKSIEETSHQGGTLFAPNNWAFKKLGPKINAFLFSDHGEKYLRALLKYHIVADQTLYSDAFYNHAGGDTTGVDADIAKGGIPKGRFHIDLPTQLEGKSLSIDIIRFGGFITIRINGYNSIAVQDGIAKDGVIHVLSSVLIPPKSLGGASEEVMDDNISVNELMQRLGGYVEEL